MANKKKNKNAGLILMLAALVVAIGGTVLLVMATMPKAGAKTIAVEVTYKDETVKDWVFNTEKSTLAEALEQQKIAVITDGTVKIADETAENWQIAKNGEPINKSPTEITIADGESYSVTYKK